jgi:6-phosphofructokinase 1
MRIGILTGGGDVPGLNPCIKALVSHAADEGFEVLGIRRGWSGLLSFNLDDPASQRDNVLRLNRKIVRTVDRSGGTFLHTSRTNPSSVKAKDVPEFLRGENFDENVKEKLDYTPHVLKVIEHLGLDALIPIGGDDTLSYGERLHREGVPVVAIPKTMDNDVYGTDYCIGFSTAVTRSVEFIHQLRTSAGSHERVCIVELFGRNSGETSLISSYLAGVDRAIISEVPFDVEKLARFLTRDKRVNPSHYAMMTISEGAHAVGGTVIESGPEDAFGHRKLGGIGEWTSEALKRLGGFNTIYQRVAYLMRSGAPDSLDLMVAVNYANIAMDLVSDGRFNRMVALRHGTYTHVPLKTVMEGTKRVDVDELYDVENYRPKTRRVEGKPMFLY